MDNETIDRSDAARTIIENLPTPSCAYCDSPRVELRGLSIEGPVAEFLVVCSSCGKEDLPALESRHILSLLKAIG